MRETISKTFLYLIASSIAHAFLLTSTAQEIEHLDLDDLGLEGASESLGGFTPRETRVLSLAECVELAMLHNPSIPAAQANLRASEALLGQAKSAYWPHVSLELLGQMRDENFTLRQSGGAMELPGGTIPIPATSVTLPANTLGPGSPSLQIPVPASSITLPASRIMIPDQTFNLLDRQMLVANLGAKYLLLDGGGRRALRRQAEFGVEAAEHQMVSSMLETRFNVANLYHTAILMSTLAELVHDFELRWEGVTDLTKAFFEAGSEMVNKTDYLRSKALQATIVATRLELQSQREQVLTGLANHLGLDWDIRVEPADKELEVPELMERDLSNLIADVYQLNPDWKRMQAGLAAASEDVRVQKSEGRPRLALFADLHRGETGGRGSLDENLNGWILGIGLEVPLFNGQLNRNKLREARARLEERQSQSLLLERGLATLMKKHVQSAVYAGQRVARLNEAYETAAENADLNNRAYQAELVEAKDVYESALFEIFLEVALQQGRHQAVLSHVRIQHLIGQTMQSRIF